MGNGRQTISSATTSKVGDSPIIVAMEFDHRDTSRGTTDRVDQVVRLDGVGEAECLRVVGLCVESPRVRRKCAEKCGRGWIASQHVCETTTVALSSCKDTTRINTELR